MLVDEGIWVAQGEVPCHLLLNQANRHGLITGASGTGKTVTLKVLAEGFSAAGVPVFLADVKGDVTGMAEPGASSDGLRARMEAFGIDEASFAFAASPCRFWDLLGDAGCPVRVTISDMGPTLLARLLGLTEVQEGVLNVVFRVADDQRMLLIDLKDLRAMLGYVAANAKEYETSYGRVSSASVGAIQRALLALEGQGGANFFGEPALDLSDWLACAADGRGYVNVLAAARLVQTPQIYAMFLLWMLSELYETLPEVGDLDRPRFVFFFDEAHLLFDACPKALRDKVVQVVKLVRSKGVGIYFVTQSPSDIPDEVLAQLSNRVAHGLRAYTPAEQRAVRAAAASFRPNPAFDAAEALQDLATGEALVSLLDAEGRPSVVERARVLFPACSMKAASQASLDGALSAQAQLTAKYGEAIDRESAFEQIAAGEAAAREAAALAAERAELERERAAFEAERAKAAARQQREAERELERQRRAAEREAIATAKRQQQEAERAERQRQRQQEQMMRQVGSIFGTIGREASRQITRSLFGTRRR